MPIRPENKALYPANWKVIVARIRERSGGKCEFCGIGNYQVIKRLGGDQYRTPTGHEWDMVHDLTRQHYSRGQAIKHLGLTKIILTVAHLDHNPANCEDDNLRDLCQRCHNRYDVKTRRQGINERASINQLVMTF